MLTQLRRSGHGPLLSPAQLPPGLPSFLQDASSVFNPGAIRLDDGSTVLLLRVQSRGRETALLRANARPGQAFDISPDPVRLRGLERIPGQVFHIYDPRITRLEGELLVVLALDTDRGGRLAIARGHDLQELELVGLTGDEDTRNGVLFPERIGGRIWLLDRPNRAQTPGEPASGESIRALSSTDLREWREEGVLFSGRPHYWDERIGAGPPPLKVREGWLLMYHGVATHFGAAGIYQAGVALLDRENPTRVLARCRENILEPREPWELVGQVPNVVFPSGWTVSHQDTDGCAPPDAEISVYYGAADTCVGHARCTVGELVEACGPIA
ncbi:MAG: glycoside hydrolase family 130 protein [Candidatus Delongbacteria bacterium]|nr:glycoside hydrolase family 130 protein [Candidatus Delongbacteria bacterium]